jgi:hypothetical protein
MKNILMMLVAASVLLVSAAFAAPKTLTGTLTDTMCAKGKHMMPGKSDAECIRACVKSGAKWALLSEGKVYVVNGDATKFNALAGKRVTVAGEVNGTDIAVTQIAEAK